MKNKIIIVFCMLLILVTTSAMASDAVTDFSLKNTKGKTIHLSDYLGENVILVNFWATWCVPCQQELPLLEGLYAKYKDKGLVILGIAADGPATAARVKPHSRKLGLTFPVLVDRETKVTGTYNPSQVMPYTIIIGKDKKIQYSHQGYSPGDEKDIEKKICQLLGQEVTQ